MSLRAQLNAIYKAHGELTPKLVVAEAADVNSPLHHRFEWDDSIAGPKYRLQQAAELVREVKITFKTSPGSEPMSIRAFHNVTDSQRSRYVPIEEVQDDPFAQALLLKMAKRDWNELKKRYSNLVAFFEMVKEDVA